MPQFISHSVVTQTIDEVGWVQTWIPPPFDPRDLWPHLTAEK